MGAVGGGDAATAGGARSGPRASHADAREHDADVSRLVDARDAARPGRRGRAGRGRAAVRGLARRCPSPTIRRALALHRLNALRELRGALHGAAVLTVGLAPVEAIAGAHARACSRSPDGPRRRTDPEPFNERWALAEARTDRMFGRHLGVLDGAERGALVEMLGNLAS